MDVQATTPVDPRVLDKMLEFYTGLYGNPHSSTHAYGWETDKEVEKARTYIADVINADPKEIIFTSGATETNNMAIKGVPRFYKRQRNISSRLKLNTNVFWIVPDICKMKGLKLHIYLLVQKG